jgi:hypothetical protein
MKNIFSNLKIGKMVKNIKWGIPKVVKKKIHKIKFFPPYHRKKGKNLPQITYDSYGTFNLIFFGGKIFSNLKTGKMVKNIKWDIL